jgi:hypothetical protein
VLGTESGLVFERQLGDGIRLRAEARACRCGRPLLELTRAPIADHALRHVAKTELEKVLGETLDLLGRKGNAAVAHACGMRPGEPYRRPRAKPRRQAWPRQRLAELAAVVLAREDAGEPKPGDLSLVAPWHLSARRTLELLRKAEELGLVKVTRDGRRNRYEPPSSPA